MAVHVYGNPCAIEEIEKIAKKYGLKVIYDAAHAFGVKYHNKDICTYGDVSMLSFHATKVFNTIEGGALIYNDNKFYEIYNSLKNFGICGDNVFDESINAKMNEFQSAMGICNLKYVPDAIQRRKLIYNRYLHNLTVLPGIKCNIYSNKIQPNYAYFPIEIDKEITGVNRDTILIN